MFESIINFFKKISKKEKNTSNNSKDTAKERLHLVLMQDRANVSVDFLELMKQEIIDVIKKYIDIDEGAIDVRLTNKENEDGTNGAPALYANIPIINIKNDTRKIEGKEAKKEEEKAKEIKKESDEKEKTTEKEEINEEKREIEENAEIVIDAIDAQEEKEELVEEKDDKKEKENEEEKNNEKDTAEKT